MAIPNKSMPQRPAAPVGRPPVNTNKPPVAPPSKPAGPPSKPSAPPQARPVAPPPKAAPPSPVKPAAGPPKPSAPPAKPATPPPPAAAPGRKGGPAPQAAAPPVAAHSNNSGSVQPQQPSANRQAGGKAQMKEWLLEFINTDAEVQAALAAQVGYQGEGGEEPEGEEAEDIYSELRDESGDINAGMLYEAAATLTVEQLDGLPELLGEQTGFAYPVNCKGLIPKRKFLAQWLEENAGDPEESEETDGSEGDTDGWCENTATGEWFYAHDISELQAGDVVCFTKDLAAEGQEPGSAGYAWLKGNLADPPTRADDAGDNMLCLRVQIDKDNRAVMGTLASRPVKIGEEMEITYYYDLGPEVNVFEYVGVLKEVS